MVSIGARSVGPFTLLYAPKGPVFATDDTHLQTAVVAELERTARSMRAIWLKLDPDIVRATGVPNEDDDTPSSDGRAWTGLLTGRGWRFSDDQVQFRNTLIIDLTQSEDDILMAMSQNTRRKVRQATKKGVTVRSATTDDLRALYDLYQTTGERDDFLIRPFDYYATLWREFMDAGLAHALIAEYEGQPIAHVVLFHFGRKCWYFYGASSDAERQRMPNYVLQWEAMRWAKSQGYQLYDMWGAPDVFDESDSMWGVYEFKRGFRGTVTRHVGAWDFAPFPPLYTLYRTAYPRLIDLLKRLR